MGLTEKGKYVTAAGAKTGDKLILTKSAGIEGTAILATDREEQLSKVFQPNNAGSAKALLQSNQRRQRRLNSLPHRRSARDA